MTTPPSLLPTTTRSCRLNWPSVVHRRIWVYLQAVLGLLVPLIAVTIFNVMLLRRLRALATARTSAATGAPNKTGTNMAATVAADAGGSVAASTDKAEVNRLSRVPTRHRKRSYSSTNRLVPILVGVFAVCHVPYHVMEIVSLRIVEMAQRPSIWSTRIFVSFNAVAQILVFVASCCNPILYGIFNKNYRKYLQCATAISFVFFTRIFYIFYYFRYIISFYLTVVYRLTILCHP